MNPTDTPRTDAARTCNDYHGRYADLEFTKGLERELAISLENQLKTQAEVERLKEELSDMECEVWPEMARLKSEVEFWKSKAYEAEQSEGKHEAEVENIKKLLKDPSAVHINTLRGTIVSLSWDGYEHILGPHPCRERAEKAEAEVAELKENAQRIGANRYQEINTLQSQLNQAVEIAQDALWFARIYENVDKFNEIDKLWAEIEELKKEIK